MKTNKKLITFIMLIFFAFVVVSCAETETTVPTTVTSNLTTGGTQIPSTEESNGLPYFEGLFTKQTYYIGSQDLDLLSGAKALDLEDGELKINLRGAYTTRVGSYTVYAYAQDSDGNIVTEEISLTVKELTDYVIPETLTEEDITIELWHSNGSTVETALNDYAEAFEEIYPNIDVVITKSGNNYDELRQNVVNSIRGGQIPNIVQNYPDHVMEYINYEAVISLTPYINSPTWGFNSEVEEESFTDIVLSYREENSQYTSDGEFYSLPFNKSTEIMIYNKTMFDVLIDNGTIDEVPTTWQGLFAIADELTAISGQVIDDSYVLINQSTVDSIHKDAEDITYIKDNFIPITYDSPANAFITLTRQWGGEYTTIDAQREGVILFDNDATTTMLGYFFDNRDTAFTLPGIWELDYASTVFKDCQTAVTFGSTGGARYNTPYVVNGDYVFEFGVAPMPYNADMPEERTAIQQGTNMAITNTGTDQEKLASWLFLKYLTSNDVQLDFALTTGYSPVRASVYLEPEYQLFINGKDSDGTNFADAKLDVLENAEMLMKSMAANAAMQQANYLFYDQAFIGSSTAREEVDSAFSRVIIGSLEGTTKAEIIADAIAAAKDNAERVLS